MDYTKVISTVKKYAFAIADELRQVSNDIIGELESFYQAIKQETDAIKTDVAGVKADTNINLPQKIDASTQEIKNGTEQIKTSVEEISSHIASEEILPYPRTVVNVTLNVGSKKTCVDIKGRGYLNYVLITLIANAQVTIYIYIDNRAFIMKSDRLQNTFGLLDENEIIGVGKNNEDLILKDFRVNIRSSQKSLSLNRADFISGKNYGNINNIIFCNGKIPFNTSLKVIGELTGEYAHDCRVSYELY